MPTTPYDAIIVGSGITGGWAAKELTEKGLNTLVLEAGRTIVPERDYVEHVPIWELKYRDWDNRVERERTQHIQRECYYACDEYSHQFFVSDADNPYSSAPGKHFSWIRGRQVGGKSITWGRQSYRWSDLDFEANLKEGIGADWPIRYADLAPWYDYVEEFAGISGQAEGLPQLPDGKFLPPMEMTCVEMDLRDALAKHFDDRIMTIGRSAVLTRVHKGRAACHYCGVCHRGCITQSYFSSLNSTLPAAQKTGRLTIRPYSVVHSLNFDPQTRRVSSVRVIDAQSKNALEFKGRIFFICGSTLESTRILLNSAATEFPNGLANSSGELGHNLMDHHMGSGASGEMPGHEDKMPFGNRPNGIYIPRFRNVKTKHRDFLRGYGYQGGGSREGWTRGMHMSGLGAEFKNSLKMPGPWHVSIGGFGECLPNHNNYVEVDKEKLDAWGIPTLKIHCDWSDNERAMSKDIASQAAEMLAAAGAKSIDVRQKITPPGLAIHEMGTARMGRDPKTSVLNEHNQAHEVKNLFLTDGACMASSSCVNPSLTYMALTARACDFAVSEIKKNNL
ncbi:MAG: GMC family oxidoreductase [Acidobacteria bacterium 13_1_20CM_58_21]|nr:MAG: GMC family oxidoreductase [Acidobacteria bacterium 13_1_20CM_58_21]